jgi:hypothetical protein
MENAPALKDGAFTDYDRYTDTCNYLFITQAKDGVKHEQLLPTTD